MIIKSSFKDYYDYVERINGGDPKIVYVRERIKDAPDDNSMVMCVEHNLSGSLPTIYLKGYGHYEYKWCVIAGVRYLLAKQFPLTSFETDEYKNWMVVTANSSLAVKICKLWYIGRNVKSMLLQSNAVSFADQSAIDLCRKLNQPVFTCRNEWIYTKNKKPRTRIPVVYVDRDIPILQDLGFASILSAFQMYQDIAYFMGNTIRDTPDTNPPVEVSNNDKIIGHGFDIKESFRHRKE